MENGRNVAPDKKGRFRVLLHVIGIRVVVWGGVALHVYFAVGDIGSLISGGRPVPRSAPESDVELLGQSGGRFVACHLYGEGIV